MPNATVSADFSDPVELKSLEGAFITVRPLPYGKKLERRERASKMFMEWNERQGRQVSQEEMQRISIEFLNRWSFAYDLKHCIGDHNLEDGAGKKLDLDNPATLDILDPKVGNEIEVILGRINGDEEEDDLNDFFSQPSTASEEVTHHITPQTDKD